MSISLDAVYCVTWRAIDAPGEASGVPAVAVCPRIDPEIHRVEWEAIGRGRVVDYAKRRDLDINLGQVSEGEIPKSFTLTDAKRNRVYEFAYLTQELYDAKVREGLAGQPSFGSTGELQNYFKLHKGGGQF